jgi:putative endonuclease
MGNASSGTGITAVQRGAAAEALVAGYLAAEGLTLLARNLRCRAGELDIICLDREVLVFVEVRQRTRTDFGGASASVTRRKRGRLLRAAAFHWQRQPGWHARILRFDVITVESGRDGRPELTWIKDAFRAG